MRLSLLFVGILYGVFIYLDFYFFSEKVQNKAIIIHLSQAIAFPILAVLSLRFKSFFFHTSMITVSVTIAWLNHLYLVNLSNSFILFGEAYLMLVWIWLITGLLLSQAFKLTVLFTIIYEANNILFSPLSQAEIITQHFYLATSIIFGMLAGYLIEFYKRQNFISLQKVTAQASELRAANTQLAKDKKVLSNLSQAIEQSGEAILIADQSKVTEYINPAFTSITGYQPEDIIGKIAEVFNSKQNSDIETTLKQGQTWHANISAIKKDGTQYPALTSVTPIKNSRGEITHFVSTQRDMTEYEDLETQLRQAQKMEAIGTLIGGIAHDFNNSLTGITGTTYLAREEVKHLPDTLKKLDLIEDIAFQASDMIKQLLAFSRKGVLQLKPICIHNFLQDVSKLSSISLPKNITFKLDFNAPQTAIINGDSSQLQQVIINLLNNAKDAVSHTSNPSISLCLDTWTADKAFQAAHPDIHHRQFARITVSDNGHGIKTSEQDNIFEPFYTTKDTHEGTGLGLSMVYGTAQSHGGFIKVQSTWGEGASFSLYLPLIDDDVIDQPKQFKQDVKLGSGETILLVDDDASVLETGTDILKTLGYEVLHATDGKQALEVYKAQQQTITLVILDIAMPKMDGIEAAKHLRHINPNIRIIFVTGFDSSQTLNAASISSESVILKPFKVSLFSQVIQNTLYKKGDGNHEQ